MEKLKIVQICSAETGMFYALDSEGNIWWCYHYEGKDIWRKVVLPNESNVVTT